MSDLDLSEWRHDPAKARSLLIEGICPVCGQGPWKSPLNHVARKHGIDRRTMRDACDLTLEEKVTDPELSERFAERSAQLDMSKVNGPGRPRAKQQWTRRGRETNNAIIAEANNDPRAPHWRKSATQAFRAMTLEQHSARATAGWDKKGRQPCGTRASYRRGCRCQPCRDAYLAYRRAQGGPS